MEERLDRIEKLLADLVAMVGKNNSVVQKVQSDVQEVKQDLKEVKITTAEISYKLQIMERRQNKMGTRLDNVEAEVELLHEGKQ